MNEEEKNAIEEFRKQLRLAINIDDVTTTIRNDDVETILNLIEKLQKENENLQKENEELNLKYYMLYTGKIENLKAQEVKIKSQVIPVQKVKDKIEELKINLVNMQGEELLIYESKIDVLQELLEGRK